MSLYHVLLHAWLNVGESEFAVRALSLLFAAAAPPTLYLLVRRLFDTRTAVVAAVLLAVNAYFLRYAQEARSYALLVFLVTLSTYLLVVAVDGSTSATAGYVRGRGARDLCPRLCRLRRHRSRDCARFLARRDVSRRWLLGVLGLWGLLVAPLGLVLLSQDSGQIDWITTPGPTDVVAALAKLAGGPFSAVAYLVLCGAALARDSPEPGAVRPLAAAARRRLARDSARAQPRRFRSEADLPRRLPDRLAAGARHPGRAGARVAAAGGPRSRWPGCALGLVAVDLARGYDAENESWRAATARTSSPPRSPATGSRSTRPTARIPFEYYRRRAEACRRPLRARSIRRTAGDGSSSQRSNLAGTPRAAADAAGGEGRVWVVVSHADDAEIAELTRALGPRGRLLSVRSFTGVDVRLYRLRLRHTRGVASRLSSTARSSARRRKAFSRSSAAARRRSPSSSSPSASSRAISAPSCSACTRSRSAWS